MLHSCVRLILPLSLVVVVISVFLWSIAYKENPTIVFFPSHTSEDWRQALLMARSDTRAIDTKEWDKQANTLMSETEMFKGIDLLLSSTACYIPTETTLSILQDYKSGTLMAGLSDHQRVVIKRFIWKCVYDALAFHKLIQGLPNADQSEYQGLGVRFVHMVSKTPARVGPHELWVNQQNEPAETIYGLLQKKEQLDKPALPMKGREALLWIGKRLAIFCARNRANLIQALASSIWAPHVVVQGLECVDVQHAGKAVREIMQLQQTSDTMIPYIFNNNNKLYTVILKGGFSYGGLGAYYCEAANDASSMGSLLLQTSGRIYGNGTHSKWASESQMSKPAGLFKRPRVRLLQYPSYPSVGDVVVCNKAAFIVLKVDENREEVVLGGACFVEAASGYLESVGGGGSI